MTGWNADIRSARHVVALAKHLSFTAAAEDLGITQSALSRSIQRFEASIGVRVFDRNRGGVHLTVVGNEIVNRAISLVREADQFEHALRQPAEGLQNSVTLGMGHLPAKALLSQVMARELTDNPSLHIRVLVRSSETLLSLLLLDEVEFFICADQLVPDEAPVKRSQIGIFPGAQLVRPGHPLLDKRQRRQPHEFPWIITRQQFGGAQPPENYPLSRLRETAQLEIEDFDCLSSITQNSDAIWVTASAAAIQELQRGSLCHLPAAQTQSTHSIRMMMYSRSDRSLSPAAVRLREKFRIAAKAV